MDYYYESNESYVGNHICNPWRWRKGYTVAYFQEKSSLQPGHGVSWNIFRLLDEFSEKNHSFSRDIRTHPTSHNLPAAAKPGWRQLMTAGDLLFSWLLVVFGSLLTCDPTTKNSPPWSTFPWERKRSKKNKIELKKRWKRTKDSRTRSKEGICY